MIPVNADAIPDWLDAFLLTLGFHGIAGDGCECIYIPAFQIVATMAFVVPFIVAAIIIWGWLTIDRK